MASIRMVSWQLSGTTVSNGPLLAEGLTLREDFLNSNVFLTEQLRHRFTRWRLVPSSPRDPQGNSASPTAKVLPDILGPEPSAQSFCRATLSGFCSRNRKQQSDWHSRRDASVDSALVRVTRTVGQSDRMLFALMSLPEATSGYICYAFPFPLEERLGHGRAAGAIRPRHEVQCSLESPAVLKNHKV